MVLRARDNDKPLTWSEVVKFMKKHLYTVKLGQLDRGVSHPHSSLGSFVAGDQRGSEVHLPVLQFKHTLTMPLDSLHGQCKGGVNPVVHYKPAP